jgi:hypothetical protein
MTAADQDGIYASRILDGFRLRVDWLWRRPLPDPPGHPARATCLSDPRRSA